MAKGGVGDLCQKLLLGIDERFGAARHEVREPGQVAALVEVGAVRAVDHEAHEGLLRFGWVVLLGGQDFVDGGPDLLLELLVRQVGLIGELRLDELGEFGEIRLFEEGLELVDERLDLAGVRIVLEAEGQRELRGFGLLDLALLVEPDVVLRLQPLREAREGPGAEHVGKGVSAHELRADPAVRERDVKGVVVDLDLATHGLLFPGSEEVVLERDFGDAVDALYGHGYSPVARCFPCGSYCLPVTGGEDYRK